MAEHLQKNLEVKVESEREREKRNNLSAIHNSVSESHKLNVRDKKKREGENLVVGGKSLIVIPEYVGQWVCDLCSRCVC